MYNIDSFRSSCASIQSCQCLCFLLIYFCRNIRKCTFGHVCPGKIQISLQLIWIFARCILDSQGCKVSSCDKQRLWSDLVNAQADLACLGGSVRCASDWRPGGPRFNPRRSRQHSLVDIFHEIFSMAILCLALIQEGQLSVFGERMCTILINRLVE